MIPFLVWIGATLQEFANYLELGSILCFQLCRSGGRVRRLRDIGTDGCNERGCLEAVELVQRRANSEKSDLLQVLGVYGRL